ncbi:hypothetical protein G6F60_013077 [Rhizopus arrhizus]|nr:hypothetical protein G6F60_013077 [Rhizopus arrhizus]
MVVKGSFNRPVGSLEARFEVTDGDAQLPVTTSRILPDMFAEGTAVVASGRLQDGIFVADEVLAKHDENAARTGSGPAVVRVAGLAAAGWPAAGGRASQQPGLDGGGATGRLCPAAAGRRRVRRAHRRIRAAGFLGALRGRPAAQAPPRAARRAAGRPARDRTAAGCTDCQRAEGSDPADALPGAVQAGAETVPRAAQAPAAPARGGVQQQPGRHRQPDRVCAVVQVQAAQHARTGLQHLRVQAVPAGCAGRLPQPAA